MTGIHVRTTVIVNGEMHQHTHAGADRQRTLEVALGKVPEQNRAGLRKQLRGVIEGAAIEESGVNVEYHVGPMGAHALGKRIANDALTWMSVVATEVVA
jgi:hypothetical protein